VRKEGRKYWEVDTDPVFALSVVWDIPRRDGVGKPLKKTHTWSGSTGVRTRDLPNAKWRARRLATLLGHLSSDYVLIMCTIIIGLGVAIVMSGAAVNNSIW
jgi:hypothetical protein